ncbi:MAG TPA: gluconate 2-dehydrogenase subunit 3 family protein, partial [Micrococcaceae bacterium]
AALDEDAFSRHGASFALLPWDDQSALLESIQEATQWHEFSGAHVWSLWTRYACTAFYSHPSAWDEIGFAGPAYPRGYKNLGLDAREPFEVADARPQQDPAGADGQSPAGRQR